MTSASIRLESGSAPPPCLTAMMILFPYTALIFAFLASVLDFVAARTAAARPIKRGERRAAVCLCAVDGGGATKKGDTAPPRAAKTAAASINFISGSLDCYSFGYRTTIFLVLSGLSVGCIECGSVD